MFRLAILLAAALTVAAARPAQAQFPTTVQLPTFSFFTVRTTVSVPDSGAGLTDRAMRDYARRRAVTGFDRRTAIKQPVVGPTPAELRQQQAASPAKSDATGLRALSDYLHAERDQLRALANRRTGGTFDPVDAYLQKANAAQRAGKPAVARAYLRMAARQADGPRAERIAARLAALEASTDSAARERTVRNEARQ